MPCSRPSSSETKKSQHSREKGKRENRDLYTVFPQLPHESDFRHLVRVRLEWVECAQHVRDKMPDANKKCQFL
jgi:hypothetical protein